MTSKLTDKQKTFCEEYLIDLNATKAAIRAGYSEKTAAAIASQNLIKLNISEYIAELKAKRSESTAIDAAWVLRQAVKVHERCMQAEEIKDREGGSTGEYKFEHSGANKALEIIGKHIDVQAFTENVKVNAEIAVTQTLEERLTDGSKR